MVPQNKNLIYFFLFAQDWDVKGYWVTVVSVLGDGDIAEITRSTKTDMPQNHETNARLYFLDQCVILMAAVS